MKCKVTDQEKYVSYIVQTERMSSPWIAHPSISPQRSVSICVLQASTDLEEHWKPVPNLKKKENQQQQKKYIYWKNNLVSS